MMHDFIDQVLRAFQRRLLNRTPCDTTYFAFLLSLSLAIFYTADGVMGTLRWGSVILGPLNRSTPAPEGAAHAALHLRPPGLPASIAESTLGLLGEDFAAGNAALLATQAILTIVLASLSPFTVLWYASFSDATVTLFHNAGDRHAQRSGDCIRYYKPLIPPATCGIR
jgi:hypothetical protein